jgi:hypothetical protein
MLVSLWVDLEDLQDDNSNGIMLVIFRNNLNQFLWSRGPMTSSKRVARCSGDKLSAAYAPKPPNSPG